MVVALLLLNVSLAVLARSVRRDVRRPRRGPLFRDPPSHVRLIHPNLAPVIPLPVRAVRRSTG